MEDGDVVVLVDTEGCDVSGGCGDVVGAGVDFIGNVYEGICTIGAGVNIEVSVYAGDNNRDGYTVGDVVVGGRNRDGDRVSGDSLGD